jgi:anti-sigma B factor antagonist
VAPLTAAVTALDSGSAEPYTLVELAGEADVTSSGTLHALLAEETAKQPGLLIVEMSGLRFLDSSALQVILRANLALVRDGGRLALVSPSDVVARVLHMTEADRLIPVYASVAEATAR